MQSPKLSYQETAKRAAWLKQQVCELLDWTEMEYCTYQYECGLKYLDHYILNDEQGKDCLIRTKEFWNWWKNQWTIRDKAFVIPNMNNIRSQQMKRGMYFHLHNPKVLASDISPSRVILDASYSKMIQKVIDKEAQL